MSHYSTRLTNTFLVHYGPATAGLFSCAFLNFLRVSMERESHHAVSSNDWLP